MSRLFPVFAAITVLVFSGCSLTHTAVSMTINREGEDPVFYFQTRGMNGLLSFRLWHRDTKQVLWDVDLNYYRERRLGYGEVPTEFRTFNGALNRARQIYPDGNHKPQRLPPGTTFMVELVCQYDTSFTPGSKAFYFLFSTDASGALSRVTRPERIAADDLPKPK